MFSNFFRKIKDKFPRPFVVAALGIAMIVPFVVLFGYTSFIIQRYPADIYSGLMEACMHDVHDLNTCKPYRQMMFDAADWATTLFALGCFLLLLAFAMKTNIKNALLLVALIFITPYFLLLFLELLFAGKMILIDANLVFFDGMCKDLSFLFLFNHGQCQRTFADFSVGTFFAAGFGFVLLLFWIILSVLLKFKVSLKKIILAITGIVLSPVLIFLIYLLIKFWSASTSVFPYILCNEITYTRPGMPMIDWCYGVPGGNCPPQPPPADQHITKNLCIWDSEFLRTI